MIGMLMCNQDSVQIISRHPDFIQSLFNPFITDSGIYQNMGLIAAHIDAVSTAAACYTYHPHLLYSSSNMFFIVTIAEPRFPAGP